MKSRGDPAAAPGQPLDALHVWRPLRLRLTLEPICNGCGIFCVKDKAPGLASLGRRQQGRQVVMPTRPHHEPIKWGEHLRARQEPAPRGLLPKAPPQCEGLSVLGSGRHRAPSATRITSGRIRMEGSGDICMRRRLAAAISAKMGAATSPPK